MPPPGIAVPLLLQVATVVAAVAGLVRVAGLRAYADDGRLRRLAWFFGLLAGGIGAQLLVSAFLLGRPPGPEAMVPPDLALLVGIHHALMLAALVVALRTFAMPWQRAALVAPALLLLGHNGHWAYFGLVEAVLTLVLAIASLVNQRRRRTPAALRVAAAFVLVFLGHVAFFFLLHTGGPRPFLGEAFTLAGVLLLVSAVPRRPA